MPIRITGLASGLDTEAIISALVSSYNYKTEKYKKAQTKLSWKQDAWKTLNTKIYSLYTSLDGLRFSSGYNLKSTTCSDTTKATVTATSSAVNGTQKLNILQVAQAGYLTGGKLDSTVTSSTTLAELGYTGGDGKINLTLGDGTTKSITVSQGTTISSFVNSLKEAGVNASYDETNKRIYVSSKETGVDNDFTLTGGNTDGISALSKLGLNISSDATDATYQSYAKYYYDGYDITGGVTAGDITQNIKDAIDAYNNALDEYNKANAQNSNLTAAYGYASAYSAMQQALEKSGLSANEQKQLTKLLTMTATERTQSVIADDGTVYTKNSTDEDGNTIFSDGNGNYIQRVDTHTGSDGKVYQLNDDGTYTADGKTYKISSEKDDDGNYYYVNTEDSDDKITIETTSEYYDATAREVGTGRYKITDADGNTYTEGENGVYTGNDGKTYRLDEANHQLIEVTVEDDGSTTDVVDGKTVSYEDANKEEITKTVYDRGAQRTDMGASSDTLTALKEKTQTSQNLTDDELTSYLNTLTTNINTVNTYENTEDTVLDASDPYSRESIVATVKDAYENGYSSSNGADGVTAYINTIGSIIAQNKEDMAGYQETMDTHEVLSSIAAMEDGAERDAAIADFEAQVLMAKEVVAGNVADFNSDAKKIDGQDAVIMLNGIEYTGSSNAFSINGLTITAQAVTGAGDENAVTITTQTDTQGIYDKIKDFLTQYNSLINEITSLYNAESASGYEPLTDDEKDAMSDTEIEKWEEKIKSALLRRDDSLESVMNAMTSAMSKGIEINGKTYYLSSFGIKTLGYLNAAENEQYAYHIDGDEDDASVSGNDDKLMAAITSDPDTVITFMQQLVTGLYNSIGDKMKATTLSSSYTVYNDKEMASEYSDYTDLIKKWEEKLTAQEDYWYEKFSAMETALSKLQSQTSSLTSMLGG